MKTNINEKKEFVKKMLKADVPYKEIQELLKHKFGSGMSNTTLKKLAEEENVIERLQAELQKTKDQLVLFKKLYFDIVDKIRDKLD
jgi:DNA-binding transcriptional MerR regulator